MTPLRESTYAALIAVAMLVMLAMLAFVCADNRRLVDDAAEWRGQVIQIQAKCRADEHGGGICSADTFERATTSTSTKGTQP
jgi:hypothetical protein